MNVVEGLERVKGTLDAVVGKEDEVKKQDWRDKNVESTMRM
jgi:hypothetical protein